jgi:outer membrane lipoprotein-sorting protein
MLKKSITKLLFFVLFLFVFFEINIFAASVKTKLSTESKTSAPAQSSLINKISGEKGFKADFEQKSIYTFTKKPRNLKGSLLFKPEKNFIWEVKGENATKIVSNGKTTWIYTPAEEEGDKAVLMVKETKDYEGPEAVIFDPKYKTSNLVDKDGFKVLEVKGTKKTDYKWLKLKLKPEKEMFDIHSIEFEDLNGTKVFISVKNFNRLDKAVLAKTFDFKAPKGTRIIE